jgi:hypothetical protein
MKIVQFPEVNIKERVTVQDDKIFGLNLLCCLPDCSTGKEGCVFVRIDEFGSPVRCAEIGLYDFVQVARRKHYAPDSGVHESVEQIAQEWSAIDRSHGFWHIADHVTQASPEASG